MNTSMKNIAQLLAQHEVDFTYKRLWNNGMGKIHHFIIADFIDENIVRFDFDMNSDGEKVLTIAYSVMGKEVYSFEDIKNRCESHLQTLRTDEQSAAQLYLNAGRNVPANLTYHL